MLSAPNKLQVAATFTRHAAHYQEHAKVQQQTAAHLLQQLQHFLHTQQIAEQLPPWLLDLGCGPGVNTQALQPLAANYVGLDIAAGMVNWAQAEARSMATRGSLASNTPSYFLQADMEQLPFASRSMDIIYSNLAVQWCSTPAVLLTELARVLQPQGIIALSTVLPNSLQPLAQFRRHYHGAEQVRSHHSWPQWLAAAEHAGLSLVTGSSETLTAYFPSLKALLHSIGKVGASVTSSSGVTLSRNELHYLQQQYGGYRQAQGLPLTYEIGYLLLQKHTI